MPVRTEAIKSDTGPAAHTPAKLKILGSINRAALRN